MGKSSKRSDVVDAEEEIRPKFNRYLLPKARSLSKFEDKGRMVYVSRSKETNSGPAKKLKKYEPKSLSCALKPFYIISYNEFRNQTTNAAAASAKPVKLTKASKTLTASNLSTSADKSHVIDFFKQAGDIVDLDVFYKKADGELRACFAHIEFSTEEAAKKAIKFHGLGLLGKTVGLSPLLEGTGAAKKLVMKNIPFDTDKLDVIKFFKQAADIVDVCLFYTADQYNRSAHIEFVTEEAAKKAERLNGLDLLGSCVGLRREVKGTGRRKTLCLKNVPLSVDKSHVIDFFEDVGDVADVRLSYDEYGTFKGIVHVEFATEEAAKEAVKRNGRDLKGCSVELDIAPETLCVQGFDTSSGIDQIRSILTRHFRTCRRIFHMDIAKDHLTGVPLGTALIKFTNLQALHRALDLDGQKVNGTSFSLTIKDYVPPAHS